MQQKIPLDFKVMKWYEKLYWRVKLFRMDHPYPLFAYNQWGYILEPSYWYIHTEKECEDELNRRKAELLKIIEDAKAN